MTTKGEKLAAEIKKLKAIRESEYKKLANISKYANLAQTDPGMNDIFNAMYSDMENVKTNFLKHHNALIGIVYDNEGELNDALSVMSTFDETYYKIKSMYTALFTMSPAISKVDPVVVESCHVNLPKIHLMKFKGDLQSFPTFLDMYNSLIHNNAALSPIEKFNYLLSSLEGPALSVVKCLPMSGNNYEIAYQALVKRYKNKRWLSQSHWSAIENAAKLNSDDPQALRNLLDIFSENLEALRILDQPVDSWDFILVNMLLKKIDHSTATRFELQANSHDTMPKYRETFNFLENHCNALFTLNSNTKSQNSTTSFSKGFKSSRTIHTTTSFIGTSNKDNNQISERLCIVCRSNHSIYRCPEFNAKNPQERFHFVKDKNLCVNCLSSIHTTSKCNSRNTCYICHKRHHSLLHFNKSNESPLSSNIASTSNKSNNGDFVTGSDNQIHTLASLSRSPTSVLLATACVEILDIRGNYQKVRAVIDSGSQSSLITQRCVNRLGLPKIRSLSEIQGVGELITDSHLGVSLVVRPVQKINCDLRINAIILPRICSDLPNNALASSSWTHLKNLTLADPEFFKPGSIDLLLGADVFPLIVRNGRVLGDANEPIAINTIFGFIIMGKYEHTPQKPSVTSLTCQISTLSLNDILSKFWELESIPHKTVLSPEDDLCEKIYSETVSRDSEGRFTVALPFRDSEPSFPGSRDLALSRFLSLEKRLLKHPELHSEYSKFLQEYLDLNHMELLTSPVFTDKSFYLPHSCVIKEESLTTKVRVVFNASSKINNLSLNDTLLTGQKLQKDICKILLRFRLYEVVLTADIQKMYRQILVTPRHRDYQRILWRFDSSGPISDFRLNTVTYGVSSAPYLALRTLLKLAEVEKHNFPRAAEVLANQTFVDDIIVSCPSVSDAKSLKADLTALLRKGGFELHKWASNKPEVLSDLPSHLINPASLSLNSDEVTKVLGLRWQPSSDTFMYKVIAPERLCTKRNIVSELARIFDPLGFLTPVTFAIKHLIQKLWVLGLDWDATPPEYITLEWRRFLSEMSLLSNFCLPRRIDITNIDSCVEVHGFCDSSERGYAAVVYFRNFYKAEYQTYFVCAKSRVAPLKTISIPRLELCAAVLLSELINYVLEVFSNIRFSKIYAWSDSSVTLAWIKSHPHRWKPFISNRISFIQERVDPQNWYHVPGSLNPADVASRGSSVSELITNSSWWAAPEFLKDSSENWPCSNVNFPSSSELNIEEKKNVTLIATTNTGDNFLDTLLGTRSSLNTVKRILCYVNRFVHNCRSTNKFSGHLSHAEQHNALLLLVRREQEITFTNEISKLNQSQKLPKPFQKLNIFLDENNIIRVGGRLHHSALTYDKKYPVLLPYKSRLTYMIIEAIHLKYFHAGLQTVQFLLCQNFWILSAKSAIRHVLSKCVTCFKTKPQPLQPLMGNLPPSRVLPSVKSFLHSGLDYAGPVNIKLSKIRGAKTYKAYICLFICMTTKAIHLELVSDLTADAFLAALRRFVARRGQISHLYSDNATCFVKANKDLIKLSRNAAATESIKWHFIPPSAPHFGGLWEAGVKSMKHHLIRVIGEQTLTYEELNTILCQTEAILNSRPITPLSSDPNDLSALTPGHFLTLTPLTSISDENLTDLAQNRLNRWQLLQRMHQDLWKRWHREYLHTLQQRNKWLGKNASPKVGTLVLIKEDNISPLKWLLGRIRAIYPGTDGVVRVVDVWTSRGLIKRPVTKICPLPLQNAENA